jgi:3-methylcrotonyl-CoA carboxylase beta subunit
MTQIGRKLDKLPAKQISKASEYMKDLIEKFDDERKSLRRGGGEKAINRQHQKNRLTARERVHKLIDANSEFFELGLFAAWGMYKEYGTPPGAGVVAGIGKIQGRDVAIIANDATVKAGASFEVSLKKTLRVQQIALENHIPVVYMVDSAGVFLPLQDQVFPDENHYGRIFYNNARLSALGVPQIASVMGPCVAGGAYLPVMCDKFIMVEGASMFLAGPALVKAAIGQETDIETLGGAVTHNAISGTADYHEPNDMAAIERIKKLIGNLPPAQKAPFNKVEMKKALFPESDLNAIIPNDGSPFDMKEIIARFVDRSEFDEYKATYGKTIICGHARVGGFKVGIVSNQKLIEKTETGEMQMGGVIYNESADKAARFIMNCNQDGIPLIFIHDVNGFMVGKEAEWAGIAKDGAKMVQAVANSVVPKITLVVGGSYGAGNYALSGRAYSPRFMFAWPSAKIAVMGGAQAANTLAEIRMAKEKNPTPEKRKAIVDEIKAIYDLQSDPRYAAARIWIDEIINPEDTRQTLIRALEVCENQPKMPAPNFGVLQV